MEEMIKINLDDAETVYKVLIGSIVPRPIAWVATQNKLGIKNVAPFSFYTVASRNPATLMISIGQDTVREGSLSKDTLSNIKETEVFTIGVVTEAMGEKMYHTSLPHDPEVNELDAVNMTSSNGMLKGTHVIDESPITFELKLMDIIEIGTDAMVLGTVTQIQVDKNYLKERNHIDIDKLSPVASLAGDFATISKRFDYK